LPRKSVTELRQKVQSRHDIAQSKIDEVLKELKAKDIKPEEIPTAIAELEASITELKATYTEQLSTLMKDVKKLGIEIPEGLQQ